MKPYQAKGNLLLYTACFLSTLILFQICYGFGMVVPTNISWMMTVRHDWGQYYLGWLFYRHEPWSWPLGHIRNFYYPLGTNVGFTDCIPLLAIFFKLFAPILPADFQYYGLWMLACQLLTACYTIKLFRLFKVKDVYIFIAVLFFVANPVLIYRGLHCALCAQWLILGSIYNYFRDPADGDLRKILRSQWLLLALAAMINPYMCFMVLVFVIILPIKLYLEKTISRNKALLFLGQCLFTMLFLWYITGLIGFSHKEDLNVSGAYGLYSLNLNALYNGYGWSLLFPTLKDVSWHQYEGFMYLGAGIFLLLLVLLVYWLRTRMAGKPGDLVPGGEAGKKKAWGPLWILLILLTLFAVTHVVSLNDKVLFTVPIPKLFINLGETFRASARFFWIPYYLIYLFCLVGIVRMRIGDTYKTVLLTFAIALQLYDTQKLLTSRHLTLGTYVPPMSADWRSLVAQSDQVVLYPPFEASYGTKMDYQDFSYFAGIASKPINTGYVARADAKSMAQYQDSLVNALQEGQVWGNSLYITMPGNLNAFANILASNKLKLHMLDGYCYLSKIADAGGPLGSLADRLDAGNKQLDSLVKAVMPIEYRVIAPDELDQRKMTFYIEKFKKGRTYLNVHGWTVIDGRNDNKGDSLFSVLISPQKTYIAPAKVEARPDITARFKVPYLDDAGFNALAATSALDSGEYKVAIGIKPVNGRLQVQVTDSVIRVDAAHTLVP